MGFKIIIAFDFGKMVVLPKNGLTTRFDQLFENGLLAIERIASAFAYRFIDIRSKWFR